MGEEEWKWGEPSHTMYNRRHQVLTQCCRKYVQSSLWNPTDVQLEQCACQSLSSPTLDSALRSRYPTELME